MALPRVGRKYVLVVEDDPGLRELYRSALNGAGFAVVAVEDGLHALHRIELNAPAVLVLDLELPRLAGRDVHREVRARPETAELPIIVVTGTDTSDLELDDFACVLRKPVTVEALIAAVQRCLRHR